MRDLGWSADETIAFFTEARRDIRRDSMPRYARRDARISHAEITTPHHHATSCRRRR